MAKEITVGMGLQYSDTLRTKDFQSGLFTLAKKMKCLRTAELISVYLKKWLSQIQKLPLKNIVL